MAPNNRARRGRGGSGGGGRRKRRRAPPGTPFNAVDEYGGVEPVDKRARAGPADRPPRPPSRGGAPSPWPANPSAPFNSTSYLIRSHGKGGGPPLASPSPFRPGAEGTPFVERPFPGQEDGDGNANGAAAGAASPARPPRAPSPTAHAAAGADADPLVSGLDFFGSNDHIMKRRAGSATVVVASTAAAADPPPARPRSGAGTELARLRRENADLRAENDAMKARLAAVEAAVAAMRGGGSPSDASE